MRDAALDEVKKLAERKDTNQNMIQTFLDRLSDNIAITEEENTDDHFIVFFLPVHKASKSIFLGHHIKADDWLAPGGHMKKGEAPMQTLRREFAEELRHVLDKETIELFDLLRLTVKNSSRTCTLHYDFWYNVYVDEKIDFAFDKSEFYDGRWVTIDEAYDIMKRDEYKKVLKKLYEQL